MLLTGSRRLATRLAARKRAGVSTRSFLEAPAPAPTPGSSQVKQSQPSSTPAEQQVLAPSSSTSDASGISSALASSSSGAPISSQLPTQGSSSSTDSKQQTTTNPAHRDLVQRRKKEEQKQRDISGKDQLLVTNAPPAIVLDAKGKGREVVEGEWRRGESGGREASPSRESSELRDAPLLTHSQHQLFATKSTVPPQDSLILSIPDQPATAGSAGPSSSDPSASSSNTASTSTSSFSATSSAPDPPGPGDVDFLPFVPLQSVTLPHIRHPFNTAHFVSRLEKTGEFNRGTAEELMRATKALLTIAEDRAGTNLVAKADLENEAYLFSAALAELRTEVQMTARTDGIALRSMNSQLQREVDSLSQKVREDINTLKNDNQLELNNRKEEASTDVSILEQKILDVNSKFTLVVGDTRAALEANKWIQTRRSIVAIAALAICVMAYVSTMPQPPPPAPPRPPSIDELGLKQIEEPYSADTAEVGFFSGWLSGSGGSAEKVEGKVKKDSTLGATKAEPERHV